MDTGRRSPRAGDGGTAAEPARSVSIVDDLERCSEAMGDAEAFRFFPDEAGTDPARSALWTWRELRDRVRGVARELAATASPERGARVLLVYPAGLDFVAAFLGCLHLGAVPVPVSPPRRRETLDRCEHIARDAGVSAVLCAPMHRARLSQMAREEGLGPCLAADAADPDRPYAPSPDGPLPLELGANDLAFLQYTSGSTSAPKGVMVTHGMLMANLEQIRQAFAFAASDRIVGWLPHYHDMGLIGGILTPVHLGVPNAMMSPAAFLRDPLRYLELAGRLEATILGGPNFGFEHCVRHAKPEALARIDLSHLRFAFSGAETVRADTMRRFHETFCACGFSWEHWVGCYGMAEATLCISVTPPGSGARLLEVETDALAANAVMPGAGTELAESGAPAKGVEVAIVDPESGRHTPDDHIGEIWVRGANVATGYWNKPEASAETFDWRLDGVGGWLRTGDLGGLRAGRLFVTGRLKELIVIRGQNHYPHDIEATVADAHADIRPGRVAVVASAGGTEEGFVIVCELTRHACRAPQPEPILAAIRSAVAEGHGVQPARIALIRPGGLPVTSSGKIKRLACRERLDEVDGLPVIAEWQAEAPATPVAAAQAPGALADRLRAAPPALRRAELLAHLRDRLSRATAAPPEDADQRRFFDMGLDSVSGIALVSELETALDLPLDPTLIYEHPTPSALADHLLARLFAPAEPRSAAETEPDDDMRALRALLASDP